MLSGIAIFLFKSIIIYSGVFAPKIQPGMKFLKSVSFVIRTNPDDQNNTRMQLGSFLSSIDQKIAFSDKDMEFDDIQFIRDESQFGGQSLISAFAALYKTFPNAEWFIAINPRTFVFTNNLAYFLRDYDSSKPYFFGAPMRFKGCGIDSFESAPFMAVESA